MSRYRSPLTDETWEDARPVIAVILSFAHTLHAQRPRRRPSRALSAALTRATDAVGAFASLPKLVRNDLLIGAAISEAYWQAKAIKAEVQPLVDEIFLRHHDFWAQWREWVAEHASEEALVRYDSPVSTENRVARLLWWAVHLTEKAASGGVETLDEFCYAHDALLGALRELEEAGVSKSQAMLAGRAWRFLAAAGRLPELPRDEELLAAFDAALMAGADALAVDLVRQHAGKSTK